MSSPILSQDEIEALLQRANSPSPSENLQAFLQLVLQNMMDWINSISEDPLEIEGPYVERLGKSLEQSFSDETYVVVADLNQSELLMLISASDASFLAEVFKTSPQSAVEMLGQAWIAEIAQLMDISYQIFQPQMLSLSGLGQVILQPKPYLVRHLFTDQSQRFDFSLIIQDSDGFEILAKQAMEQILHAQAKGLSKGKLLKANKTSSPVARAIFTNIDQETRLEDEQKIDLLEDIDLTITVELGLTTLTLNEILELEPQSVISLERHAGEPVDVYVNQTRAAKAEVVVLEENFGVRILEILPKLERLQGV